MIKGFEPPRQAEPLAKDHLQWIPAIAAGFVAGVILLVLPHASPWEGLTVFTPAILGRLVPAAWAMPVLAIVIIHFGVSLIYGLIVSVCVMNIHELRAVIVGGLVGLVLYCLNLGIVSQWIPALKGNEVSVIVTHFVFGLIAAGAYRGLLRRQVTAS